MDKLKKLLSRCKCGVFVSVNEHRDYYLTPQTRLQELDEQDNRPEISEDIRAGIIKTGNIVEIQFFPDTPIGSYTVIHYDLDAAIDTALECLE